MKSYEQVIGYKVEDAKQMLKDMEVKYNTLRILKEDDVITMEHNATRLNLVHNENDFITAAYFG